MISCYEDWLRRILEQEFHSGKEVIKGFPTQMETIFQLTVQEKTD